MTGEGEGETRRRKATRIKTQKRGAGGCNKVVLRRGETTEQEMIKTETGGRGGSD